MTRILCFGDSITQASSDLEGGWTQRLHNYLAKIYVDSHGSPKHEVQNLGVDGDTSSNLLSRIKTETQARARYGKPLTIIFIGTNDAANEHGKQLVAGEEYLKNLTEIITIAQELSEDVLVLGLLPCDDAQLSPVRWSPDTQLTYSTKNQRAYNVLAKKACTTNEAEFIDLLDIFGNIDLDRVTTDGLHPNAVGQQLITDRIKKRVAELANGFSK